MKKQVKLSQGGKLYLANITIDDSNGQVIDSSLKQVTFPEKSSLTFSVLLNDETKARYSVSLDGDEALAIRKKANNENSWLRNFVSYTAKNAVFCHAIFSEIQEINEMESTQLGKLESLETNETVVDLINSVIDNAVNNRIRTLRKLQDNIDKYNTKHGTINDIFDFAEKLETVQGISCSLTKAEDLA
jgi:hypothetical protein